MDFSVDFFRDEVRCGFYIPTAIKQAWAAELEVLDVIERICAKAKIRYFADWGTILGAVRHGGFVPWDDDLDVCMLRDDYIRFRQVADAELPEGYVIHDYARQEDHWLFLARIVNNKKICFEPKYLNKHHNFPYLAGVDIFVKDYLYEDPGKEKERDDEIMHILAVADGIVEGSLKKDAEEIWLKRFEQQYGIRILPELSTRDKGVELYRLAEKQMSRVKPEETDTVGQIFPMILKGGTGQPKSFYEESIRLPFENTTIPVPASYDTVLKSRYGDYLKIHKVWTGHNYPFFEGQKAELMAKADFELTEYKFDRRALDRRGERTVSSDRKIVYFFCTGPMWWKSVSGYYEKECADTGNDVYVVALPLLFKDCYGELVCSDEELALAAREEEYPEGIRMIPWYELDMDNLQAVRIYIQDVYDGENPCLTIPPVFYSSNLREHTKELICIPALHGDDFAVEDRNDVYNLKHYALAPGIVYADRVIIATEILRERYIEKLTEWAGIDTKEYWEAKLLVDKGIYKECSCDDEKDTAAVTEKKRLLFVIGANEAAEYHEEAVRLLGNKIDVLAINTDAIEVNICLYPPDPDEWERALGAYGTKVIDNIERALERGSFGFIDMRDTDMAEVVEWHDAYYGSASPLVHEFIRAKKPVMIADLSLGS